MTDKTHPSDEELGLAGKLAKNFIHSPLSPLLLIASLAVGVIGLILTPRQEDPQISVPMVDVFVSFPGTSADQVSTLATDPLERMLSEITGVKHVYSASKREMAIVTVEFDVGQEMENSILKVYDKIESNVDKMPPGVKGSLVKPKAVDDVPVVTLTLWSEEVDDSDLRLLALDVLQQIKEVPETSASFVVGGRSKQLRVEPLPEKLAGYGVTLDQLANTIKTANSEMGTGKVEAWDSSFSVYTGSYLKNAADIEKLVVAIKNDAPVYVSDIATVMDAPSVTNNMVHYYTGSAYLGEKKLDMGAPAVTIAIAKKKGSNGVSVAHNILKKVESLKGRLIPDNVTVEVTRNYGETADKKVTTLIKKLFIATGIVVLLVWGFLGVKAAIVVLIVIPVVILITVFAALILGLTIDRVSLFALIFSIGILVDDAIVVVENIYRRWLMKENIDTWTSIDAVREVGNPTILATFTVIAALMPMGMVRGMMGPYMSPIPTLGSIAMLFSLFAAFTFTPWLVMRIKPTFKQLMKMEKREHRQEEFFEKLYRSTIIPLITKPLYGRVFLVALFAIFFFSCSLFYFNVVKVKMLPLDNKPEFNITVNFPAGSSLPLTENLLRKISSKVKDIEEVTALQTYAGTASPYNFNGLVRHTYLREEPWQGDIQVQLTDKTTRKRSSHEIANAVRKLVTPITDAYGAKVQVIEMPPGPPVLQSVVAEVYGPSAQVRRQVANDLTEMFKKANYLTDVDNLMQKEYEVWRFVVDTEKAIRRGVSVETINRNLRMAMGDFILGDIKVGHVLEPRNIVLQIPMEARADFSRIGTLPIMSDKGITLPLSALGKFVKEKQDQIIYHKDLRPVEFVTAEVQEPFAAPVYGMFEIGDMLKDYTAPDGVQISGEWFGPPENSDVSGFEWTGEWTVTYETFRDMGMAFGGAIILIYMLVVWEFGNFTLPAIIISPIPLTLVGIIPGHWLWGADFTATSMIGFIALAGIIVRNSILIVDFTNHRVKEGAHLIDAVIASCRARTRPILITAFALMGGSIVILSDPIFQGMAVSLFFGIFVSTLLTLVVIPLGCATAKSSFCPTEVSDDLVNCEKVLEPVSPDEAKYTSKEYYNTYVPSIIEKLISFLSIVGIYLGLIWSMIMSIMPKSVRNFFEKVAGFLAIVKIYLGLIFAPVMAMLKPKPEPKPEPEPEPKEFNSLQPQSKFVSSDKSNNIQTKTTKVFDDGTDKGKDKNEVDKDPALTKKSKSAPKKLSAKDKVVSSKKLATKKKSVSKAKSGSKKKTILSKKTAIKKTTLNKKISNKKSASRRGIKLKKGLD